MFSELKPFDQSLVMLTAFIVNNNLKQILLRLNSSIRIIKSELEGVFDAFVIVWVYIERLVVSLKKWGSTAAQVWLVCSFRLALHQTRLIESDSPPFLLDWLALCS